MFVYTCSNDFIGSDKKCAIDIAASLWCRMVVVYIVYNDNDINKSNNNNSDNSC